VVKGVACGEGHTSVLLENGDVLGCGDNSSNPFKQLSDLELGDEKVTLNHRLVNDVLHISLKCELIPNTSPWLFESAQQNDHVATHNGMSLIGQRTRQGLTYIFPGGGFKHFKIFSPMGKMIQFDQHIFSPGLKPTTYCNCCCVF